MQRILPFSKHKILLTLVLSCVLLSVICEKTQLTFAVVLKLDAMFQPMMNRCVELAIADLNANENILPNTEISLVKTPLSIEVEPNENLHVFSNFFLSNSDILGLVGLYNALMASEAYLVADIVRIPMITTSTSPEFSDKDTYPYYARAVGESQGGFVSMAKIIANSGFRRTAYVGTNDVYGIAPLIEFSQYLQSLNIQLISTHYHTNMEEGEMTKIIEELDIILDELNDSGAKVIIYNAHFDEVQLMLWRAFEKGMLGKDKDGEVIQWILTEDACFSGLFTECDDSDCKAAMPEIMLKAAGTICIMSQIPIEEDWYKNTWIPNTTKEKLTEQEINISGTDDWDKYFNPQSVFSYDSTILLAHALHEFCIDVTTNKNEYLTFDDCLKDLRNRGEDIMKYFPRVSFDGATGNVNLNENYEREMNQEIFQWTGTDYQLASTWIPASLSETGSDVFQVHEEFIFASLDGCAPPTVFEQKGGFLVYAFSWIGLLLGLFGTSYGFFLLRKDKVMKTKRKANGFFNSRLIAWILIISTLHLIVQFLRSLFTIGSNGSWVSFFVILQYIGDIPLVILLAGLLSRSYRFMIVTNNRKMKRIKFSRGHSLITISLALLILLPFEAIHYYGHYENSKDSEMWTKTYVLQDSNPVHYFTLPSPEYDDCVDHDFMTWTYKIGFAGLIILLSIILGIFSHISVLGIVAPSMRKVTRKEISLLRLVCTVCIAMQFTDVLLFQFNEDNGNDSDHSGFENGKCGLSLDGARINVIAKFLEAFLIWLTCFLACYLGYLNVVPTHKKKKLIKRSLGISEHGFSGSGESDSESSYSSSMLGSTTASIVPMHELPKMLADRLKELYDDKDDGKTANASNLAPLSKYAVNDSSTSGSERSKVVTSRSTTISIHPSPSHVSSRQPAEYAAFKNSYMSATTSNATTTNNNTESIAFQSLQSCGSMFASSKIAPAMTGSTFYGGSGLTLSSRDVPKFNARKFRKDVRHMDRRDLSKLISRLRSDQSLQTQSYVSLIEKLNNYDEKLEQEINRMEVLEVRTSRENSQDSKADTTDTLHMKSTANKKDSKTVVKNISTANASQVYENSSSNQNSANCYSIDSDSSDDTAAVAPASSVGNIIQQGNGISVTRLHPVIDHKTKRRTLTFNKSKSNVQSSDDGSGYLYPKLSPPEKDRSKPTTTTTTTTTTTHSLRSDGSSMPSKSFC
eukprot:TRINITY_DN3301_c0_g1_i1.p1 TRINITY_DN3301_c0_g1~~TRINITY_DN3301_c0_g1_i1.p1  ORF type:complete len:1199 (-),score=293.28 TRINITY_DN3301_c0_g1_i1:499-4095(-)